MSGVKILSLPSLQSANEDPNLWLLKHNITKVANVVQFQFSILLSRFSFLFALSLLKSTKSKIPFFNRGKSNNARWGISTDIEVYNLTIDVTIDVLRFSSVVLFGYTFFS